MSTSVAAVNSDTRIVKRFEDMPAKNGIESLKAEFAKSLPAHITADRFCRVAQTALMKPEIAKLTNDWAGRKSIYDACMKAAADGLLLDGREAALAPYGSTAQYMPMVAGIMKKARNSGEIKAIFCDVVYTKDRFTVRMVTDGVPIDHEPALGDRGDFLAVYAVALLRDGSWTKPELMDKGQVDAIRAISKTGQNGPWKSHYNEMARKTVIRRAAKYWPSSTDKDDWMNVINDEATEAADIAEPGRVTVQERKRPAAAALLSSVVDDEPEVIDADPVDETSDEPADADV